MSAREALRDAKTLVVKVGSSALTDPASFTRIATQLAALHARGIRSVLVSSGAIALGRRRLGLAQRPRDMPRLQAAAAAGQSLLVRRYEEAFEPFDVPVAQVLLTHADLTDRDRYLNARRAIEALLELNVVPIINENDTVAVDEIRFGDNDQLAAMVATLVGADLLVLLTDVEGLLDGDARVSVVEDPQAAAALVRPSSNASEGRGGMGSKLDAALRATKRGVPVVIASSHDPKILEALLAGDDVGTLVLPHGAKLASRKHWIAFTLRPRGDVVIDGGAVRALKKGASLLAAGVVGVRGEVEPGDAVRLVGPEGEVGRGLIRYGTLDVARMAGAQTDEIEARLGRAGSGVVVHRDDLVVDDPGSRD